MGGEISTNGADSGDDRRVTVLWRPENKMQVALLCCPVFEIFIGGARGGGKSDGCLGEWLAHAGRHPQDANGLWVRRQLVDLRDTIERSKKLFIPLGATYNEQTKIWKFPGGARLTFAHLESDGDADSFQGHSYTRVYVEEMGQFAQKEPIFKLMATLSRAQGIPCKFVASGNPAGAGHHWIKERYIEPARLGYKVLQTEYANPFTGDKIIRDRVFLPSKVTDNPFLGADYIANLQMSGPPDLVKAWLEGDWDIHLGAYFPMFGARHVCPRFAIPKHWQRYLGFDWGYHSPFCAGWAAVSSGKDDAGKEVPYPKNSLIFYREWTARGIDNIDIARGIVERSNGEDLVAVADPSIFAHDGGPSINDQFRATFAAAGIHGFKPADNDRISGWSQITRRLTPNPAMIYFMDHLRYLLATIPALQIDQKRPEDVDTTGEDHGGDMVRYVCKERLLESALKIKEEPVKGGKIMVEQYIKQVRRDQQRLRV